VGLTALTSLWTAPVHPWPQKMTESCSEALTAFLGPMLQLSKYFRLKYWHFDLNKTGFIQKPN
jgi:hypothetical protein